MARSEKSMPPTSNPSGGMTTSATADDTILPNAAPMMMPTAMSTTLPRTANALNSWIIFMRLPPSVEEAPILTNTSHIAFNVHLARSRLRFVVEPGETVLAAGLRQGLALPFGCQSGTCASCRVRLLEGRVAYAPSAAEPRALSQAERDAGYILMCQALPQSDLELQ